MSGACAGGDAAGGIVAAESGLVAESGSATFGLEHEVNVALGLNRFTAEHQPGSN